MAAWRLALVLRQGWFRGGWSARAKAALRTVPLPLLAACCCCWPSSWSLAGFSCPQWRAPSHGPPPHCVSSFRSPLGIRETPTLQEQAKEHLAAGTELWQMLLLNLGSGCAPPRVAPCKPHLFHLWGPCRKNLSPYAEQMIKPCPKTVSALYDPSLGS